MRENKQLSFSSITDLIEEAREFITTNLSAKGKIFVGFSGGKDSIVTADLISRSGIDHQLYYSVTGIDPPDVVRFIKKHYPECIFLRPKRTFWYHITRKNPPSKFHRWCCRELKEIPSDACDIQHRVFGLRAEESVKRSKYQRIAYIYKKGYLHYSPIFRWSEYDVWEYIDYYQLNYPVLYDDRLSRIGCVICPFHSNKAGTGHNFYRRRYPRMFKMFEKKVTEWFVKRKEQGKQMFFPSAETFIENWYRDNVRYYKH